ncbi:MAG: CHAT domain-containing protein [Blastocatellia bacterium]
MRKGIKRWANLKSRQACEVPDIVLGGRAFTSTAAYSSFWKVDDWATSELMKRFYKKMISEGQNPSASLRAAQIEMWRQDWWRAPYYWAAFVVQGEPN